MRVALRAGLLLAVGACAVAPEPPEPLAAPEPAPAADPRDAASEGQGTLRTEQITVELRDAGVVVRVTPLAEELLRLAAPDTRRRLSAVASAQRAALAHGPADPGDASLFLVSFLSAEPDRSFEPTALSLEAGGQHLRPVRILPLTPGWGEQRLRPHTPESAVYVFDRPIFPFHPLVVHYGSRSSDHWRNVIPLMEAERRRQF